MVPWCVWVHRWTRARCFWILSWTIFNSAAFGREGRFFLGFRPPSLFIHQVMLMSRVDKHFSGWRTLHQSSGFLRNELLDILSLCFNPCVGTRQRFEAVIHSWYMSKTFNNKLLILFMLKTKISLFGLKLIHFFMVYCVLNAGTK